MLDRATEMTALDDGDEIDTIVASLPERLDLQTAKEFAGENVARAFVASGSGTVQHVVYMYVCTWK